MTYEHSNCMSNVTAFAFVCEIAYIWVSETRQDRWYQIPPYFLKLELAYCGDLNHHKNSSLRLLTTDPHNERCYSWRSMMSIPFLSVSWLPEPNKEPGMFWQIMGFVTNSQTITLHLIRNTANRELSARKWPQLRVLLSIASTRNAID